MSFGSTWYYNAANKHLNQYSILSDWVVLTWGNPQMLRQLHFFNTWGPFFDQCDEPLTCKTKTLNLNVLARGDFEREIMKC